MLLLKPKTINVKMPTLSSQTELLRMTTCRVATNDNELVGAMHGTDRNRFRVWNCRAEKKVCVYVCVWASVCVITISWRCDGEGSLFAWLTGDHCPACRTTFIATRFRVAVICPIIPVPHCIRVFFYFVWFVFINHIFQFYYELCTYCNILDIYLS